MSIWSKVLAVLVVLGAAGMAYMAARSLKTEQVWKKSAQGMEQQLAALKQEAAAARDGSESSLGIARLEVEVYKVIQGRGRAWRNVAVQRATAEEGKATASLTIAEPSPHGITEQTVLYVYDSSDADKGGKYLGEFRATKVADKSVDLESTRPLTPRQRERLSASRGPWNVYDAFPVDSREAFAGLSEEQLKAMLPEGVAAEYIRDGKKADPNDADERKDRHGNYARELVDYAAWFDAFNAQLQELKAQIDLNAEHEKIIRESDENIKQFTVALQKDKEAFQAKVELAKKLSGQTVGHVAGLQRSLEQLEASINRRLGENLAMSQEISRIQLEASRRIDARTGVMADAR